MKDEESRSRAQLNTNHAGDSETGGMLAQSSMVRARWTKTHDYITTC